MALKFDMHFPNLEARMKQLGKLSRLQREAIGDSLNLEMIQVLRDSKTKTPRVPVEFGALQSTGHVMKTKVTPVKVTGGLSYGGLAPPPFNREVDYAVVTHEDTSRSFHRPGAGPKYVSTHIEKRDIDGALVSALDSATKRSGL